ncbi:MAG TPA: hypothetical protein VFH53_10560 [Phycisphaerae bacterium]|nr:hypothetical protein [Phycisphaerae bacterium]
MAGDRLKIYGVEALLDRNESRAASATRGARASAEVSPGGPPYRLLWCRVQAAAPADPPDERYYADEVRPAGVDSAGHVQWELVPDGLRDTTVHNVAEAALGTHLVPADTVVQVEERLDRRGPPEWVYLMHVLVEADRLARVVSYESGAYTVQPVRREAGGFVDDGPMIVGVPNLGELWPDEAGYLAGPENFDRYVRLFRTPAGWTILLHPPRMV